MGFVGDGIFIIFALNGNADIDHKDLLEVSLFGRSHPRGILWSVKLWAQHQICAGTKVGIIKGTLSGSDPATPSRHAEIPVPETAKVAKCGRKMTKILKVCI